MALSDSSFVELVESVLNFLSGVELKENANVLRLLKTVSFVVKH